MPKEELPKSYLESLVKNHQEKALRVLKDPSEKLLMYSGALLNWVGEYINDESIKWELKKLPVNDLTLTGTSPEWNEIIIKKAKRSPQKFKELLSHPQIKEIFEEAKFSEAPILVRVADDKLKVLDGMNRVIAAIRDGVTEIEACVGTRKGKAQPKVEPHVIYDLIRAFQQRGGNEQDFKASLRFLVNAYSNVKELLQTRLGPRWIPDEKINQIIKEVLEEK
jgi:hypothetical protein